MKLGTTEKIACFTLDLEADYAGMTPGESYESLEKTGTFERLVEDYDIKLTTFVTGHILDTGYPVLERLAALGSRFETHSYSHPLREPPRAKIKDIRKGIEAYERYFGERPRGYRAPQGLLSREDVEFLSREGLTYSSSIFPSYLPGRYNNLNYPTRPFVYREAGLLEIPISVIPGVRLPITASHINLFSYQLYHVLFSIFGCPRFLNICTHLYDFADVSSYSTLPLKEKIGYLRTRLHQSKSGDLEKFICYLLSKGYHFTYLGDVAEEIIRREGTVF